MKTKSELEKYTCVCKFADNNMPSMRQIEDSESLAMATINHWSKQFAGIRLLYFFDPWGNKVCFSADGRYLFTIPLQTCQQLGLTA
jgi:hypothetical protein